MFKAIYSDAMIKNAPTLETTWKVVNTNVQLFARMMQQDIKKRPKGCQLFLFGRTNVQVISMEHGNIVAEGYVESNIFGGHHDMQIQLVA